MPEEQLSEITEVKRIGARTFATGALVQMMVMFLFFVSLRIFGGGKAFWISPIPSTKGSVWVNLGSFESAELLPSFLLTSIIFTVLLFVIGFRVGANIWKKKGSFVLSSLLAFLLAALIVGGLCALMLEGSLDGTGIGFVVFIILIFFIPGILSAVLSGWATKKRLEDFAHKSGVKWP